MGLVADQALVNQLFLYSIIRLLSPFFLFPPLSDTRPTDAVSSPCHLIYNVCVTAAQ